MPGQPPKVSRASESVAMQLESTDPRIELIKRLVALSKDFKHHGYPYAAELLVATANMVCEDYPMLIN